MGRKLIHNATIYTPTERGFHGWVIVEDQKILTIQHGTPPASAMDSAAFMLDAQGAALLPGFIDIHTHGALGYCTMDADVEGLQKIAVRSAAHGVTAFLPTTLTDDTNSTLKAIRAVSSQTGVRRGGAKIAGIYLEGPYFNPVRAGAQNVSQIRRAGKEEIQAFADAGTIRVIAMAPEYPENLKAAEFFAERGITVSAGHSDAPYETLLQASEHGFNQITHLYNGMSGFGHREPGMAGGALTIDAFSCELICDNVHSHPAAQKLAWQAKGADKLILITDCIRPSGLENGTYPFTASEKVTVSNHGKTLKLANGSLAGSSLTMDEALRNFVINTGATLDEVWPCTSLNAARQIGISAETGSIEKGKLADLVLLDDQFRVKMTMIEGTVFNG